MARTWEIRPYESGDEEAVLDLLRVTMGETAVIKPTSAFWRWKHMENPFGASYVIWGRQEDDGRAVSLRAMMKWRFRSPDGRQVMSARAVDTATGPGSRRQGIFSTLTRKALDDLRDEGVVFIFNTPNEKSLPGYLKMGWHIAWQVPLYIKVLRPLPFLKGIALRRNLTGPLPPWGEYFGGEVLTWKRCEDAYGAALSELIRRCETARAPLGLRTPRTVDYLRWRYGRHPHLEYGVLPLAAGRGLGALAILKPNLRWGMKEVALVELFDGGNDADAGEGFLKEVLRESRGDYLIASFPGRGRELPALRRTGFLKVPRMGVTLTVRELNGFPMRTTGRDAWDLSLGDLEMF